MNSNLPVQIKNFCRGRVTLLLLLITIPAAIALTEPLVNQALMYDTDEGTYTTISYLLFKGFPLYTKVYVDQPPVMFSLLSVWFSVLAPSIYYGRLLILVFSVFLLLSFYNIVKLQRNRLSAWAAIIFLVMSTGYLRLSISIMNGLPALAFSMAAIHMVYIYKKKPANYLLALSGTFMAFSLQTKLFTVLLIPPLLAELIHTVRAKSRRETIPALSSPFLLWGGSLLLIYVVITMMFFHSDYKLFIHQIITPHLKQVHIPGSDFSIIIRMLFADYETTLLAFMGGVWLIYRRTKEFLFPLTWMIIALAALMVWQPIWYHYYLLISIPLSWLAAISIGELWHVLRGIIKTKKYEPAKIIYSVIMIVLVIIAAFRIPYKYSKIRATLEYPLDTSQISVIQEILKYKPYVHWMVTDIPVIAFYDRIPVVPELALIAHKRSFRDRKSQKYFIEKMREYKPELVLLSKFFVHTHRAIIQHIEKNYTKTHCFKIPIPLFIPENPVTIPMEVTLYVRKKMQNK